MTHRKILHAADIHLDSPLQKLEAYEGAPVDRIRGASRRALEHLVQLAIDQSVDLVVIAGDLYDGDWPDQNTGLFFVAQASKLVRAGIPMVVIRGNHDAANVMTSTLPLPSNPDGSEIMLSSDRVDRRVFESIGVAVHGRSFRTRAETENLATSYPSPIGGLFNIGLLHTSLTGAEGHDPYAPCTPSELADKRYDYWALGHVHTRGEHQLPGAAPVVFSGNVQGRHVRETGAKGCVIVDVDSRGSCGSTFYPLDVVRWERCAIDVSTFNHVDEVIDAYQVALREQLDRVGQRLLVTRVELVGRSSLHDEVHRRRTGLKSSLLATAVQHGGDRVWLEAIRLNCSPPEDRSAAWELDGPAASLAEVAEQLRSDPEAASTIRRELSSLIKKLPSELGEGDDVLPLDDPQWLNGLIESATADISGRLRQQEANA